MILVLLAGKIFTHTLVAQQPGIVIPVVVHVVWNDLSENISDEQIQSQIEVLNEDFQARNNNLDIVPAFFRSSIANLDLSFCLAQTDPDGQISNGITRTQTSLNRIGTQITEGKRNICYTDLGGKDAWDTQKYLNVWVGKMDGLAGEASFPGQDSEAEDGIRIDPERVGRLGTVNAPYHLGRTLTHEIGHFFNLQHLWGMCNLNGLCCSNSDPSCACDDGLADTPPLSESFLGDCPTTNQFICGTLGMYMNFMTFANDACLALFTQDQKEVIWNTLNTSRAGLLQGEVLCEKGATALGSNHLMEDHTSILLFPNPASTAFTCNISDQLKAVSAHIFHADGTFAAAYSQIRNEQNIAIDWLPTGAYWIKFESSGKFWLKKLIIVR